MRNRHKGPVIAIILTLVGGCYCSRSLTSSHSETSTTVTCRRHPSPLKPPDLSNLSPERLKRFRAVQGGIQHAWNGYVQAINQEDQVTWHNQHHPPDDLNPISHKGESWLYFAATLHDSVDTLYLAQLNSEYQQAREWILNMDLQTTSSNFIKPTKTFEYSLRVVGGMLGAYSVSGDLVFLHAAKRAADALLEGPFADSWTPLPRMYQVLAPSLKRRGVKNMMQWSKLPSWLLGVVPRQIYATLYAWGRDTFTNEHIENSLAGVGSFGLEFEFLSDMTNIDSYRKAQTDIFHVLETAYQDYGGFPILWNVQTGEPYGVGRRYSNSNNHNTNKNRGFTMSNAIGSGADSFYEYLVKIPILKECAMKNEEERSHERQQPRPASRCMTQDESMLIIYNDFITQELLPNHVYRPSHQNRKEEEVKTDHDDERNKIIAYPTDNNKFYHLLCFVPGMLALGVHHGVSDRPVDDLILAEELVRGCYDTYHRSPTGLGPEVVRFHRESPSYRTPNLPPKKKQQQGMDDLDQHSQYQAVDRSYFLRPELVESLFVLYRVTKNPTYQEWAWEIFESIELHCKRDWGYAGVVDVYHQQLQHENEGLSNSDTNKSDLPLVDDMPSFFIAETLKYLLLIFGPDDYVSLDEFVFTTEAHPLWIPKAPATRRKNNDAGDEIGCNDFDSSNDMYPDPPIPIPWLILSLLLIAIGALVLAGFGCVFTLHGIKQAKRRTRRLLERKTA